ncbi:hypothetical protein DENIS_3586 [Desulfonema ishimotonii]|uniref:Uncharacterized protein n=1 Tax=Desulfonema ishimotonii TaxID=45657 RepID=A0A401G065_9BACT|nr:hypothetical protein [Desulfonema ishimotonii]GBC62614.1 hypothetical protein DENIS_3586 [Desulfonema ishimotonii]
MGWKKIATEKNICPCGKGTYKAVWEKDEWNRVRTNFCLNCSHKRRGYDAYFYEYQVNGLWLTGFRWVESKVLKKARQFTLQSEFYIRRSKKLAEDRYLDRWLDFFSSKNKRQIWEILSQKMPCYCALPTFYRHVKKEGLTPYLIRFFRANNQNALELLDVKDKEIEELNVHARWFDKEAENLIFRRKSG